MSKDSSKILSKKPFVKSDGVEVEKITYQGDEHDAPSVEGIIAKPIGAQKRSLPLIIFNTPGTKMEGGHADHQSNIYGYTIPYASKIGRNGAIVVSSSLREADEYGGADVKDVLDIMEIGKQQPEWDGRNVIMIGFSRGAMMTYLAIKEGAKLTGAIVAAGETDLYSGEVERKKADGNTDIKDQNTAMIPGLKKKGMFSFLKKKVTTEERKKILESRSAVYWPEKLVDTPMLILHGAEDKAVALHHATDMNKALTENGGTNHRLRIVDEECWVSKKRGKEPELGVCQHGVLKAKNSKGEYFVEQEVIDWCNARIERVHVLFHYVKTGNINEFIRIAAKPGIHPANIRDEYGKSLLHYAAYYGHIDMFKCLVNKYRLDPNHASNNRATPMHEAAYKGHIDMVKYLVSKGLKPTYDSHKRTPLRYAASNGQVEMAEYLMKEQDLDPNETDSHERTLFSYAVEGGHIKMVDLLALAITKGNTDSPNPCACLEEFRKTLLHRAASHGHIEMFDHLVSEYRLDPSQVAENGETPMHEAAHWGHAAMIEHLASKYHLDVTARDLKGATPLDYANGNGKMEAAKLIQDLAIKARVKNLNALDLSTTVPISHELREISAELGVTVSIVPESFQETLR